MPYKRRTVVVFISGSAGELDWILPILDFLLKENFRIKIIFLSRHALRSVKENAMCNNFINKKNDNIEVICFGTYFFEKMERVGYFAYRALLKYKLSNTFLIKDIYNLFDFIQQLIFIKCIPKDVLNFKNSKILFFAQYPSLRRPMNNWIKKVFKNSIFFYFPHSPHIYTENLDQEFKETNKLDFKKKSFLLLGHPSDYNILNDERELAAEDLEKVFIGHPKYSQTWMKKYKLQASNFRKSFDKRKKINILVLSRGHGSVMNEVSQKYLVDSTIRTIDSMVPEYNLFIKKHPREFISPWDKIVEDYPSVEIINHHILQLATKADFVVSFWGSGSMDCFMLGLPVIEFWDPIKNNKQQVPENNSYTTIYRKLGVVLAANNEMEFKKAVNTLIKNKFNTKSIKPHSFYNNLVKRSNNWKVTFKNIISAKGF